MRSSFARVLLTPRHGSSCGSQSSRGGCGGGVSTRSPSRAPAPAPLPLPPWCPLSLAPSRSPSSLPPPPLSPLPPRPPSTAPIWSTASGRQQQRHSTGLSSSSRSTSLPGQRSAFHTHACAATAITTTTATTATGSTSSLEASQQESIAFSTSGPASATAATQSGPILSPKSEIKRANDVLSFVGVRSTRAKRDYNEDRFCISQFDPETFFFAVFDGHGGSRAADYVTAHMHRQVHAFMQAGTSPSAALSAAFQKVNDEFCDIAQQANLPTCGTTAVAAVMQRDKLYVANAGDSRALLCRSAKAVMLSTDHKPDLDNERERIEKCGGEVIHEFGAYRLQGLLTVSRAIGDISLREYGLIATPDVVMHDISERDAFLLLASDGLFDVLTPALILDIVRDTSTPEEAAIKLTMEAEMRGTDDNTTSLVVKLPGWKSLKEKYYGISTPFGRRLNVSNLLSQMDKYMPASMSQEEIDRELAIFEKTGLGAISRAGFRVFDETQTGFITFSQLEDAMKRLGETFTKEELRAMFDEFDANHDGKITYDEFVKSLRQFKEEATSDSDARRH